MRKHKVFPVLLFVTSLVGLALALSAAGAARMSGIVLLVGSVAVLTVLGYVGMRAGPPPVVGFVAPIPPDQIERVAELEGLYQTLQSNYVRKTTELQDKIDDLERFHRLAIGRELRLIELKKEIEQLRVAHQPATSASPGAGSHT